MTVCQYVYFFYVIAAGVACMVTCFMFNNVEFMFEGGMYTSMTKYGGDPGMKKRIDTLQMKFQCCGDLSYKDWFKVSWIRYSYINLDDAIQRNELRSDGKYRTDSVPFSCCNPELIRPCIFEHVKDHGIHINYNYEKDHTLYSQGCRYAMIWRVENLLGWLFGLNLLLTLINCCLLIEFRYILTSISGALKQGKPNATALAYI